jgi:hypothetical protein
LIGLDSITNIEEKDNIIKQLHSLNKEIIHLTNNQIYNHFTGNMLQLQNKNGDKYLIMSNEAKSSLLPDQIDIINKYHNKIINVPIHMIGIYLS